MIEIESEIENKEDKLRVDYANGVIVIPFLEKNINSLKFDKNNRYLFMGDSEHIIRVFGIEE